MTKTSPGYRALDGAALHLTTVVDDDASVVLEVDEGPVLAAPRAALAHHHGEHHLLTELRLALLHSREEPVTKMDILK